MYSAFENILLPLINRIRLFEQESREGLEKEIQESLLNSKGIIENVRATINKSDTASIKTAPEVMIDETIVEVNMIEVTEEKLKKITMDLGWYTDATEEMCISAQNQINSMMKTTIQLMDNYKKIQNQKYEGKETLLKPLDTQIEDTSFYNNYMTARQITVEKDKMQNELIQAKKELDIKDLEVKNANMEMKEKQSKIDELFLRLSRKEEELRTWEQKASREERERLEADSKERKKYEEYLIRNDILSTGGHTINLMKKTIDDIYFPYIFGLVPNPVELQISQNYLNDYQKSLFHNKRSIQILKMSFMPVDKEFLSEALKNYDRLHTIELNSAHINDQALNEISKNFPKSLLHIHLIDNKINDEGLDHLFQNLRSTTKNLHSLYVSYNNLTPRSMGSIKHYCENLKILHISKNPLKIEGNKQLKPSPDIEELFIGGTGIKGEGFVALTKNFLNLKRLSLVSTELSTDIVSELLLGLEKLEWLDISYSNLTEQDKEKVEKLKIFNKLVEIVYEKT